VEDGLGRVRLDCAGRFRILDVPPCTPLARSQRCDIRGCPIRGEPLPPDRRVLAQRPCGTACRVPPAAFASLRTACRRGRATHGFASGPDRSGGLADKRSFGRDGELLAGLVGCDGRDPANAWVLVYGAAAVLLGAALAGFYLIPAAYEEKWVNLGELLAPGVRPFDNFLFTNINDADHNRFNLLVSIIAAAEILVLGGAGFLSRSWRREKPVLWWTLSAWAGAAVLLMCPFTFIFWDYLPKLRFVQLPWRWLLCLNVAFALLVTVACRRWATRLVLCGALFGLVWTVGHRVQQPWWDTSADIEELHDAIADGGGYEGTDEYVPADADPYEVNKSAPPVAVVSGARARIEIGEWSPQAKVFSAEVPRPEKLRLRLFDYPAWVVEVNGSRVVTEVQDVTGEIVVPVQAGANLVRVTFIRTRDRLVGNIIALLALLVALVWAIQQRRFRSA
jgi:hypothetical protein